MSKSVPCSYGRFASWILVIYLSVVVSGCASRPAALAPEEARRLQTREMNYSKDDVARAVVVALQEMHYTLGNVDMSLGLITAERHSERSLAPISKELDPDTQMSDEMETFCLVAGGLALVAILFAWIWDDDDDEEEDNRSRSSRRSQRHHHTVVHHHPAPIFVGSDDYGPDSYTYSMSVSLEEISSMKTEIKVSVQGQQYEGSVLTATGPVQDEAFYAEFYNKLSVALNR